MHWLYALHLMRLRELQRSWRTAEQLVVTRSHQNYSSVPFHTLPRHYIHYSNASGAVDASLLSGMMGLLSSCTRIRDRRINAATTDPFLFLPWRRRSSHMFCWSAYNLFCKWPNGHNSQVSLCKPLSHRRYLGSATTVRTSPATRT